MARALVRCRCGCGRVVKTKGREWAVGHNPEFRRKHSLAMTGKMVGKRNPFYGKRHPKWLLKQIGLKIKGRVSTFLGKHHTEESKRLMGKFQAERFRKGWCPWKRGKNCLFIRGCIKIWMRSPWEVAFAKWCHRRGLHWNYEPKRFDLSVGSYLPDFFVREWQSYVELKGAKMKKALEKLEAFMKETSFSLVVLFAEDLSASGVF